MVVQCTRPQFFALTNTLAYQYVDNSTHAKPFTTNTARHSAVTAAIWLMHCTRAS